MRYSHWALGLVCGLAWAGPAFAQSSQLELKWVAPGACPGGVAFTRQVERFLGEKLADAAAQQLTVDGTIVAGERGYVAKLSFANERGVTTRELDHPDCNKLTEAAALLTALAIDPERVKSVQDERQLEQDSGPAPLQAPPAAPQQAPPKAPVHPPPQARPAAMPRREAQPSPPARAIDLAVELAGLVTSGPLPGPGIGVGAELGARYRIFELGLGGRYWLARSAEISGTAASIELSLAGAAWRTCAAPRYGRWEVAWCGRAHLGQLHGVGQGVDKARPRSALYAALGGGLTVSLLQGRLSPRAGVELLRSLARPAFGVTKDGAETVVFRPGRFELSAFLGLSFAL